MHTRNENLKPIIGKVTLNITRKMQIEHMPRVLFTPVMALETNETYPEIEINVNTMRQFPVQLPTYSTVLRLGRSLVF